MTEKDFDQQVWRRFDTVTLDTGIETTIMNVCFSTRSVRIYIKDAPPEWVPFKRIESHKSRFGEGTDDAAIIHDLHNKVLKHQDEIERLRKEREELKEKYSRNYLKDLLTAVNQMEQGFREKKHKMEQVENGLRLIAEIVENCKSLNQ